MYSSAAIPRSSSICGLTKEVAHDLVDLVDVHDRGDVLDDGAVLGLGLPQFALCMLELRDVVHDPLPVHRCPVGVTDEDGVVANPHEAAVGADRGDTPSTKSWPDAFESRCSSITRSRSSGCSMSIQTPELPIHSRGRDAQDLEGLRAGVDVGADVVDAVDVDDRGKALGHRAIALGEDADALDELLARKMLHSSEEEGGPSDGQLENIRALPILGAVAVAGVGGFGRHQCLPFVREPLEPFVRGIGRAPTRLDHGG